MKLFLFRHAKSSWKFSELSDRERPLNKRGKRDSKMMAERLLKRGEKIDHIYTSPAVRAKTYAAELATTLSAELQEIEELYTFSVSELWQMVNHIVVISEDSANVALVGHNPAMSMMAELFGFEATDHFPTSAVLALEVEHSSAGVEVELLYFDYPKKLLS